MVARHGRGGEFAQHAVGERRRPGAAAGEEQGDHQHRAVRLVRGGLEPVTRGRIDPGERHIARGMRAAGEQGRQEGRGEQPDGGRRATHRSCGGMARRHGTGKGVRFFGEQIVRRFLNWSEGQHNAAADGRQTVRRWH